MSTRSTVASRRRNVHAAAERLVAARHAAAPYAEAVRDAQAELDAARREFKTNHPRASFL